MVETNYSSTDIIRKIRFVLELCNVDFENVEIRYSTADATQPSIPKREKVSTPSPFTSMSGQMESM